MDLNVLIDTTKLSSKKALSIYILTQIALKWLFSHIIQIDACKLMSSGMFTELLQNGFSLVK